MTDNLKEKGLEYLTSQAPKLYSPEHKSLGEGEPE